jgi:hypothetical protein
LTDTAKIFDALYDVITEIGGAGECIMADQNAPAPEGSYASVFFKSFEAIGAPAPRTITNEDGTFSVAYNQLYGVTVMVDFWRDDALFKASNLLGLQYNGFSESVVKGLREAGICILGVSNVTNLSALQSAQMEPRAQVEISMTYTRDINGSDNAQRIEKVPAKIYYSDGELADEIEIED